MSLYPIGTLVLEKVQDAIYTWIRDITRGFIDDPSIIWRNQSEPLPPRPCVTMKITDGPKKVGFQDNTVYSGTGTKFIVGGQRVMTVSIQVFGNIRISKPMAYQLAVDLNSSLALQTVLDKLRVYGISVLDRGDPINITALEETEYEERAQFDVQFGLAQNIIEDPSAIERVGLIGKTINPP